MVDRASIHDFMQVTTVTVGSIRLVGLQGVQLNDQHNLFQQLKKRKSEIQSKASDHEYLVILPRVVPFVALEVTATGSIPQGMVSHQLPEETYAVFRFEEQHIDQFWDSICSSENQLKYNIDLSKPRFEIFLPDLQPKGITEWYIPLNSRV